jgi:hypothetical protein
MNAGEKLKLVWRILRGKAVMYRVKTKGSVTLVLDDVHIAECTFESEEPFGLVSLDEAIGHQE